MCFSFFIYLDLKGLANIYLTYMTGLIPSYISTKHDMLTKLKEFDSLTGNFYFVNCLGAIQKLCYSLICL